MRYLGWSSMVLTVVATLAWADAHPPAPSPSPEPGESDAAIEGQIQTDAQGDIDIVMPEPQDSAGGGAMLALWVDPFVVIEWARSDGTRIRVEGGGNPLKPPGIHWTRWVVGRGIPWRSGPLSPAEASAIWDAVAAAFPDSWDGTTAAPDRLMLRYGSTRQIASLPTQNPAIARVLALLALGE